MINDLEEKKLILNLNLNQFECKMPRSPVTKYERLGLIFGQPLFNLEEDQLPKKCEIVQFWMYVYETKRDNSWILKDNQKTVVRNEVSF